MWPRVTGIPSADICQADSEKVAQAGDKGFREWWHQSPEACIRKGSSQGSSEAWALEGVWSGSGIEDRKPELSPENFATLTP